MFKLIITAAIAAGLSWVASNELNTRQRAKLMETMAEDRADAAQRTFNAAFVAGEKAAKNEMKDDYDRAVADLKAMHDKDFDAAKRAGYKDGYEDGKKARLVQASAYKKGYEDGETAGKETLDEKLETSRNGGYNEGYEAGMRAAKEAEAQGKGGKLKAV